MNPIIPISYYVPVYYGVLLFIVFLVFFQGLSGDLQSKINLKSKSFIGILLLVFVILYMGLRPVNYRFGDMVIYNIQFREFVHGGKPKYLKDVLFEYFMYNYTKLGTSNSFFFICVLLYVLPLFAFCKKVFKDYWFYAFLTLIISYSFWSYGTNGIRNGIATSLFLFAISRDSKVAMYTIFIISFFIHKSLFMPITAYIITLVYNKPNSFFKFWLVTIPLSFALGSIFSNFFLKLGIFEDKSVSAYIGEFSKLNENVVLKVGFRWDFLLYSASGVFAAYYFVIKKKFEDPYYNQILNIYLMVNGFWVLVIRANFSNRFAYLSWFMLGVVIIYPLLKSQMFKYQHRVTGFIILIYFSFTYFMNVILVAK